MNDDTVKTSELTTELKLSKTDSLNSKKANCVYFYTVIALYKERQKLKKNERCSFLNTFPIDKNDEQSFVR